MATNVTIVLNARDNASGLFKSLNREFKDLQREGDRLRGVLSAIGVGLSAGAVVAYTKSLVGALAALDDVSEITGESVENLSQLNAEARISGTEFERVTQFANRLAKGLTTADEESKDAGRALKALGIDARDSNRELKNTPQLMREIAEALQRFKAGPAQQSLLQALGGRSGAELIPFFNDLAKSNERVARATSEQAAAAESVERAFRKLRLEADQTAQTLVLAAAPALEGLARGLGDVIAASRDLNDRNDIAEWAEGVAIGAAVVIDSLGGVVRFVSAFAQSVRVVLADLEVLNRAAGVQWLTGRNKAEFEQALVERNATLETANRQWSELWTYNGRAVEESVRRSIEAITRGNKAVASFAQNADARDLRLLQKATLEFSTGQDSAAKKAESFLDRLRKQVQTLEVGESATLRLEAAQLKVGTAAEPWIRRLEAARALQEQIKLFIEDATRAEKERADLTNLRVNLSQQVQDIEAQAQAIGRTADEQERLTVARQLDIAVWRAVVGLEGRGVSETIALYEEFRSKILGAVAAKQQLAQTERVRLLGETFSADLDEIEFATSLIGKTREEIERLTAVRRADEAAIRGLAGLEGEALEEGIDLWVEYREAVLAAVEEQQRVARELTPFVNIAEQAGGAIAGAFEDAIVEGRSLREILRSLEQDLLRIVTRNLVTEPLGRSLTDLLRGVFLGGGGGAGATGTAATTPLADLFGKAFAGGFASGGYIRPGQWGIAGERGPEPVFGGRTGATVLPSAMPGLPPVTQNIYVQSIDRRDSRTQVARDAARALQSAVRRG